uniref:DUF2029 domain-containing protein n=1 Tax=uncultured bacterium 213 TaxID=698383 RepID=E3T6X3_9BACT|nr:hypothetical protein [uncultured bacterium 213]
MGVPVSRANNPPRAGASSIPRWLAVVWLACWIACGAATVQWLRAIPLGQDVLIYQDAFARANAGGSPYLPIAIGGDGYTYHPAQLLLFGILDPIGRGFSWLWFAESVAAWIASLWLAGKCLALGLGTSLPDPRWLWIAAALTFGPLIETLYLGQIDTIVTFVMVLALWLLLKGSNVAAGASLALAIVLKASPVLLLLHFAALRRWRALGSALLGVGVLTVLPAVVYSPRLLSEYRQVVTAISGVLPPLFYNQSPLSVVYRILRLVLPQASFVLRNASAPLAIGLSAVVLIPAFQRPPTREFVMCSFVAIWLVALMASPLVWYHHHVFLIAAVGVALCSADRRVRALAVAGASCIQLQRAIELTGGSRWLGASAGEFAIAAAVAMCLWKSTAPDAQTRRLAWIAQRHG